MSEIADFLRARIAERRAIAEAATPGSWFALDGGVADADGEQWPVARTESDRDRADRVHIAANDPAAVIADCEAKLWIVNAAEKLPELTAAFDQFDNNRDAWARTLRLLAQAFTGHPDHKGEEWAP